MLSLPSRRRPRARLAAIVLAIAGSAQAQTPAPVAAPVPTPAALSVHDAVRAAVARAKSPAAADASAQAARELAVAAAQRPDPVLSLSLDNLPVEGPDRFSTTSDFMTMRSIGVMQTFTRADKRSARAQRFEREAEAALAERSVRVAAVQRDTAIAWFERRAAEQRQAVLQQLRGEARLQLEAAEAALRGGRATSAELIAARDALAQLEQALLDADAEVANARRALARWTGDPSGLPLAPAPSLAQQAFIAHSVPERLAHHPELLRLAAGEAQADAAGRGRACRTRARLERAADVQRAWLALFEHGVRRRQPAAALGPAAAPGPRTRRPPGRGRGVAR